MAIALFGFGAAACSGDAGGSDPEQARPLDGDTDGDIGDGTDGGTHDESDASERAAGTSTSGESPGEDPGARPARTYTVPAPVFSTDLVEADVGGLDDDHGNDPDDPGDAASANPDVSEIGIDTVDRTFTQVPAEEIQLGFSSKVAIVDHGTELGVWTRSEGVIAMLRIAVGEAPRSSVDGIELVTSTSSSGLVRLARDLAADPTTPDDDQAEITRLLERLTPDQDALAEIIAAGSFVPVDELDLDAELDEPDERDGSGPEGLRRVEGETGRARSSAPGTPQPASSDPSDDPSSDTSDDPDNDPSDPSSDPDSDPIGGTCTAPSAGWFDDLEQRGIDCWRAVSTTVPAPNGGSTELSVVYSDQHEAFARPTLDALVRTVKAGFEWSNATMVTQALLVPEGDATGLARQTPDGEVLSAVGIGGLADGFGERGDFCAVTMQIADGIGPTEAYRQVVAHEQVHCLQFADFGPDNMGGGAEDWVIEGGAEFFSHVVYPAGKTELQHRSAFITRSLEEPLMAMDYPVWVWWQYLSNQTSHADVWELQRRMMRGDSVAVLAAEPGMAETFQEFAVSLVRTGIPTEAPGRPVNASAQVVPHGRISSTGQRSETVQPFVAARFGVIYEEDQLYEQTDLTAGVGKHEMVAVPARLDRGAWGPIPEEVRAGCADPRYLLVATTIEADPHRVEWLVDEVTDDECDPCVVGTWVLDNEDFFETVFEWATSQGGGLPDQFDFTIRIEGPYYMRLEEDGTGISWRDDWRMIFGAEFQGMSFETITTMSSVETFDFRASEERIHISDNITVSSSTRVDTAGAGIPMSATVTPDSTEVSLFGNTATFDGDGGPGAQSTSGSYACTPTQLDITLDEEPDFTITWYRAVGAPDPPALG